MTRKIKHFTLLLTILLSVLPFNVYAYSSYVIASGKNIGIELNATGVIIVGTYDVGNMNPSKKAGLITGDKIIKVNDVATNSIKEMVSVISNAKENYVKLTYVRDNKEFNTNLSLVNDNSGTLKTGLYVKDSINGVGTLTFIDPNTRLYGALGHEIIEKSSGQKLEISGGKIFSSVVTGINRSSDGKPGEKNARYDTNSVFGNVIENTNSGIFGKYTSDISKNEKLYKVAEVSDIKVGHAKILTTIKDDVIEEFDINILKVNSNNVNKNLLFEIIDENLLNVTGGIVQGMSGSPIIQDDYIIGAVTHVVVDNTKRGYGIFITTMLKEAEN